MTTYGIRIRPRSHTGAGGWERGKQFRRANTPSGWTYWRDEWPTKAAAEMRLAAYRAQGMTGHVFEIDELTLVERSIWNARPARNVVRDDWTNAPLVWHHTADAYTGGNRARNIDHAQSMQYFHQNVRGWSDIAYNFLVFPNGDVLVGRGFGVRGAGAADGSREWNKGYIHVAFVGNFVEREPTLAAQKAADLLVADLRQKGARIPKEYGHGDLMATACPGRGVRQVRDL